LPNGKTAVFCTPTEISFMQQRQELRNAGLKVTLPRLKILEIFEKSEQRHLSAEDMYKELLEIGEDIGLATVYRVLTQFEAAGLVTRHNFEGGHSVFELDDGDHHDHMVCVESGEVIEFCNDEIERLQREMAAKYGYEILDHNLVLYVRPLKESVEDGKD
jgi:Fur family ferric uptake transcriptional regulator